MHDALYMYIAVLHTLRTFSTIHDLLMYLCLFTNSIRLISMNMRLTHRYYGIGRQALQLLNTLQCEKVKRKSDSYQQIDIINVFLFFSRRVSQVRSKINAIDKEINYHLCRKFNL